MSSAVMEFTLLQQTPMIHFQYDEAGAVIRGSELKPKLDKFLVKRMKKKGMTIPDGWKLKSDKGIAFNYKVKIFTDEKATLAEVKEDNRGNLRYDINGMYFGNMGDDKSLYKNTVMYNKPISLSITCFIEGLRKEIEEGLEEFFLVTNFGTRQDKGFGSFKVTKKRIDGKNTTLNTDPLAILDAGEYTYFYADIKNPSNALSVAQAVHAVMKGGLNRSENGKDNSKYIKGYIQRAYLDEINKKNVGSDKAFMKSKVLKLEKDPLHNNNEYAQYEYVRAILGVADGIDFRSENKKVKIESKEIKRMQSTITTSVIDNKVLFIFNDNYKMILNKEFTISSGANSGKIKTPSEFDPKKFMNGFVKYYNIERTKLNNIKGPTMAGAGVKLVKGGSN